MKQPGKFFWLGVALAAAGIVLMSWPARACVDCDDEAANETPIYMSPDEQSEMTESPSDD